MQCTFAAAELAPVPGRSYFRMGLNPESTCPGKTRTRRYMAPALANTDRESASGAQFAIVCYLSWTVTCIAGITGVKSCTLGSCRSVEDIYACQKNNRYA